MELARAESLRGVAAGGFIPVEDEDDRDFREPIAKRARVEPTSGDSVAFHLPGMGSRYVKYW